MNTKWIKRLLCLVLACAMMIAAAAPAMAVGFSSTLAKKGDKYVVIAKSGLHFRSGPGMNYSVITTLKKGAKVQFQFEKNSWWCVKLSNGKTGYVDKQYLTRANVPSTGNYKITASSLNVRSFPRLDAGIYASLARNTKVKVLQLNGDWCRINYRGKEGWIASMYLKK